MPGLLPNVDPDGLLEFSVVYTDRALNHMSRSFQGVMKDISAILKEVYNAHSVDPGARQRHLRHGIGGAPVRHRPRRAGAAQRLVQLPLDPDLRDGEHPRQVHRAQGAQDRPTGPPPLDAGAARRSDAAIRENKPAVVFAPHVETASPA
jgi:hypothetical protein